MRGLFFLALIALIISPAIALTVSTDRDRYSPAEEGTINIEMDVPRELERVILEIEILDEDGAMVYADVMYTQIPAFENIQDVSATSSHVRWSELPVNNLVTRIIPFIVPLTASSGNYTVVVRALYNNYVIDSDVTDIEIIGGLPLIDLTVIIFIIVLLIAIIIWKEV